jgi:hypothetical protein
MLAGLQQSFAIDPPCRSAKLPKKLRDIVLLARRAAERRRRTARRRRRKSRSARTSKA